MTGRNGAGARSVNAKTTQIPKTTALDNVFSSQLNRVVTPQPKPGTVNLTAQSQTDVLLNMNDLLDEVYKVVDEAERTKSYHLADRLIEIAQKIDPQRSDIDQLLLSNWKRSFKTRRLVGRWTEANLQLLQKMAANFTYKTGSESPKIFTYWHDGFNNAPAIVKTCHASLQANASLTVVALDEASLSEIKEITPSIQTNIANNQAFLTDLARVLLLAHFGGIWVDATCLVTQKLPDLQKLTSDKGFFTFRDIGLKGRISNWFLAATPRSYVATMMSVALIHYWQNDTRFSQYSFFHDIFESLYLLDERFRNEVEKSIVLDRVPPHQLQKLLHRPYSRQTFETLINTYPVHKLTHKIDDTAKNKGSMLSHILASEAYKA